MACLLPLLCSFAGGESLQAAGNATASDARVEQLIGQMTLDEKIAQLHSVLGNTSGLYPILAFAGNEPEPPLKNGAGWVWRVTTYLSPREGAISANTLQRKLGNTRLGIPALVIEEGLHGLMAKGATSFPQAIALASTWDPELVERVFAAVAKEARARGVDWLLTPVLDIARDPRWGRTEETYGEDPYLVSAIGTAAVRGLQGRGPGIGRDHVLATAKHFAVYGQPEGGTNIAPGNYSMRIVRDQFLLPFERVVKDAHVGAVMASYNEIDGIPSHANRWLLHDVLRAEWNFDGLICADDNGVIQLQTVHHVCSSPEEAARLAFDSGVELELSDDVGTFGRLADQVRTGAVPMAGIDAAVRHVLKAKFALGLFDNPLVDPDRAVAVTDSAEHRRLAREAAQKAIILLKNEHDLLPLDPSRLHSIAVIGPNAADVHVGGYSFDPAPGISVLDGIKRKVGATLKVGYAEGCRITGGVQGWRAWWEDNASAPPDEREEGRSLAEAVALARSSDVAVVVIGENEGVCREEWSSAHLGDRDSLQLLGRQQELVDKVVATGTPTIVVLLNGRPLAVGEVAARVPALIEGFYLGEEGGDALADVLFGDVSPGGKLPITFPRDVGQIPAYYYQKPSAKRGYLYSSATPLFPFGFGLSYTRFVFNHVKVAPARIAPGEQAAVSVDVSNTGKRVGDEVVQLYIHQRVASVTRPVRLLRGFKRVALEPGERRTVTFLLGPRELRFFNRDMERVMEPGTVDVFVGGDSNAGLTTSFEIRAADHATGAGTDRTAATVPNRSAPRRQFPHK